MTFFHGIFGACFDDFIAQRFFRNHFDSFFSGFNICQTKHLLYILYILHVLFGVFQKQRTT